MDRIDHFTIFSTYVEVRRAAEWLRGATLGILNEERTGDLELAAVEALTNIVRHAYAEDARQTIELELDLQPPRLNLVIRDRGHGVPADLMAKDDLDDVVRADELAESGRGVMIIKSCVDDIDLVQRDGETILCLTMVLQEAPTPPISGDS